MFASIKVEILLPVKPTEITLYRLLETYKYKDIIVPKGFVTDGASVPRLFWGIMPPVHRYFLAAVVHDYLLYTGHNRRSADRVFGDALKEHGISGVKRWVMYRAVRAHAILFG